MRFRLNLVVALGILALGACSSDLPPARHTNELVDCTKSQLEWFRFRRSQVPEKNRPPIRFFASDLSESTKAKYLDLATRWSLENGYLPCEYQMCAAFFRTDSPERTLVAIQPEMNLDGWVPTSASFYLSEGSVEAEDADTSHSGCAYRVRLDEQS